ncbi:sigma-70 family RNA polymerase sigma factor [Pimelobacter simplex]|uniref:Sigma-70 family RNA polymerase sigma factor n=1 Tax=Nocardioides simplex TaxID=2045 RepID=A0A7J5DU31_NOCSI|nr:sigma-70 family RNA polymerase sigma factor [Pimelobacter simplex]KAB2808402.1 sigma-70 family RNA polymerase sigma factor [Pimelobacter simplex]
MSDQPDDVRRIGHDPDAFEAFYRAHLDLVQRFVARRVSDPHLAADLTADVFLAAVDAAAGYDPRRGSPAAWVIGVARNVVAGEFRRQGRQRTAVRKVAGRRLLDADSLGRIEERIDAERETRQLYDALGALRPSDRALMELVAIEGLSVTDAAAVLGVKPATARVRLHRSRRLVQSHLRPPRPHAVTEAALTPEVPS